MAGLAGAHSGSVGEPVILDATEDFGAVVAAQDDVLRLAGDDESGEARHGLISAYGVAGLYSVIS